MQASEEVEEAVWLTRTNHQLNRAVLRDPGISSPPIQPHAHASDRGL